MKQKIDKNAQTIEVYDKNSRYYSEKFKIIGDLRQKDVDLGLSFVKSMRRKCLEIGCGSGNEAKWIIPLVDEYTGIDASSGLLEIAKTNIPRANFKLLDVRKASFPENSFDIIFSFATFLHFSEGDFLKVLEKAYLWLNPGGVIYMTLKYGLNKEFEKIDVNGTRFFYFYTPEEIKKMAESCGFDVVYENQQQIMGVDWFEMAFLKE